MDYVKWLVDLSCISGTMVSFTAVRVSATVVSTGQSDRPNYLINNGILWLLQMLTFVITCDLDTMFQRSILILSFHLLLGLKLIVLRFWYKNSVLNLILVSLARRTCIVHCNLHDFSSDYQSRIQKVSGSTPTVATRIK